MRRESKRALKRTKSLPREVGELVRTKKGKDKENLTEEPVCVDNECVCACTHMWIHVVNTKFVITSGSQKGVRGFPRFLETPFGGAVLKAG